MRADARAVSRLASNLVLVKTLSMAHCPRPRAHSSSDTIVWKVAHTGRKALPHRFRRDLRRPAGQDILNRLARRLCCFGRDPRPLGTVGGEKERIVAVQLVDRVGFLGSPD